MVIESSIVILVNVEGMPTPAIARDLFEHILKSPIDFNASPDSVIITSIRSQIQVRSSPQRLSVTSYDESLNQSIIEIAELLIAALNASLRAVGLNYVEEIDIGDTELSASQIVESLFDNQKTMQLFNGNMLSPQVKFQFHSDDARVQVELNSQTSSADTLRLSYNFHYQLDENSNENLFDSTMWKERHTQNSSVAHQFSEKLIELAEKEVGFSVQ